MSEQQELPIYWIKHQPEQGYIHHWVVAGPHAIPVGNLESFDGEDFKSQIARHYYRQESGIAKSPVEFGKFTSDGSNQENDELTWQVYRCLDDHFVDLSDFYHTCHHLSAWAYTVVDSPVAQSATLVLTTNGPADVWLNDQHIHHHLHFHHQIPQSVSFTADLHEGHNPILIRFEAVAVRECPYVMALQITDCTKDEDWALYIPTGIQNVERRQKLEALFERAHLKRDTFVRDEYLELYWPEDEPSTENIAIRVQTPSGRIYSEQHTEGKTLPSTRLGRAYQYADDLYHIVLMPGPEEYYVHGMRVKRVLPARTVRNVYSQMGAGTEINPTAGYMDRRIDALKDAAQRNQGLFSEIAKMALGWWKQVKLDPILQTINIINQRADCSDFDMVGLLGMVYRHWEDPNFPEELRQPLENAILNFKYWIDEPGDDAMCYWSENHQILFHACEILAGQLFPDQTFSNVEQIGEWHQQKGERMALSWLQKRGAGGFREWDSNTYFEEDILALSHLVDLAESDDVAEMAAVVLDKLLFTLALNSYKGVFGSTHGRTYTPYIKGAYQEPTAGISRLLWGMGIFNERILGTVSLACAENYQLPPIIGAIAIYMLDEMWSRERHAGELEQWCDQATGSWEVNKVTYKTPDYMLCSAQDYQPGQAGYQQHIWQATFSPDAVVFVTHPPCMSEDGSHRPNFWHGNVILPRVAQWKDVLVAVHNFPEDDWMGFTHAYFPTYAFDEHRLHNGWAFARVGDGYMALTASQGISQTISGDNAYRELRSYGAQNVWLCHMGRSALDGTFTEFQEKVLALDITLDTLSVHGDTLRGETIDFGWEGPLLINEVEQPIHGFKHYENPYCVAELGAEQLEIQFGDQLMRLHY